jgi:hypothetical protein
MFVCVRLCESVANLNVKPKKKIGYIKERQAKYGKKSREK